MSVNPHPTHAGWWQIKYYPDGKKGGVKTVVMKRGTRDDAKNFELQLRRSARGHVSSLDVYPSVIEAIPFFFEYYRLEHLPSGINVMARYLDRWGKMIGRLKFSDITNVTVEDYKHKRLKENIKPTTINKELSALSMLCKWAHEAGYCDKVEVKRFPNKLTKAPLPDVPTREEVLALINSMVWPRCGLFACLYYGGLRAGEAQNLTVDKVHLQAGVMIVRGKGNKERVIPIVDELRPWLEKRINENVPGLLWTTKTGKVITDLKKIIKLAKERAGLTRHFYPHLLRHAFGTHATMSGVGMRQLQNIMGHTSVTTTEVYTTLSSTAMISELVGKFGRQN